MTKTDPTLDGTTVTVTGLKLKMHHQDARKLKGNMTRPGVPQQGDSSAPNPYMPEPMRQEGGGLFSLF